MNVVSKIIKTLNAGIVNHGSAYFVVSGGSSPTSIYAALVAGDYDSHIDWSRVTITLVDERQTPENHDERNQKLIHDQLLQGRVSAAKFLPLTDDMPIANLQRPFDVTLLGMGLDGHFASLFPSMIGSPALSMKAKPGLIKTEPQGTPNWPRISMNLSMITKSRLILLLAIGKEKQKVLYAAKKDRSLPIHHLISQTAKPVEVVSECHYARVGGDTTS